MAGKGRSYCVDCYEDYVKNCLSQSPDMRGSTNEANIQISKVMPPDCNNSYAHILAPQCE